MKVCCTCGHDQPVDNFSWRNKRSGVRHSRCKACFNKNRRTYYESYAGKGLHQQRTRDAKRRLQEKVDALKMNPCMDCGFAPKHPSQMDFDHRPGETKSGNISFMVARNMTRAVVVEIAKCDLVCANCHRLRTAVRLFGELAQR